MADGQRQPNKRPRTDEEVRDTIQHIHYTKKDRLRTWVLSAKEDIGYVMSIENLSLKLKRSDVLLAQLSQCIVIEQEQLRLRPLVPRGFSYEWDPRAKTVISGTVKFEDLPLSSKLEWFLCVYQYAKKNSAIATVKVGDNAIFIVYDHSIIKEYGSEYYATFGTRFELPTKDPLVNTMALTLSNYDGTAPPTLLPRLAECTLKLLPLIRDKKLDCNELVNTLLDTKSFKCMQQIRELHPDPRLSNFCAALSSWVFSKATIQELTSAENLSFSTPQHLKAMCVTQNRFRVFYRPNSFLQYANMDTGTELKVVSLKDLKDTDRIVCIKSYIGYKFFNQLKDTTQVLVSDGPIERVGKKKRDSETFEEFTGFYTAGDDVRRIKAALKKLSVTVSETTKASAAEDAGTEKGDEESERDAKTEEIGESLDDLF